MNREMPLLPDLYMPCCDVRVVAAAHLKAMQLAEAQNHRHLIVGAVDSVPFKHIALILQKEFKNYKIPKTVGPNFLVKIFGVFDPAVKQVCYTEHNSTVNLRS